MYSLRTIHSLPPPAPFKKQIVTLLCRVHLCFFSPNNIIWEVFFSKEYPQCLYQDMLFPLYRSKKIYLMASYWWTFRWFSIFYYCKQCTVKNPASISFPTCIILFAGLNLKSRQTCWTKAMNICNFDRYCLINFHIYGINLYSYHQCIKFSFPYALPKTACYLIVHRYKSHLLYVLKEIY